MRGFGIKDAFSLVGHAVKKKKATVDEAIPTVADLEAQIQELRAAEIASTTSSAEIMANPPQLEEKVPASSNFKADLSITAGTACLPCTQDHLSTCSGLLSEALRFARKDGIESVEVISRIGLCNDELNAMERVDLRPELTVNLPDWEKQLANDVLNGSRDLRHNIAAMTSVNDLESIAATAQILRTKVGENWLKSRIANMSPQDKAKVKQKAEELLKEQIG